MVDSSQGSRLERGQVGGRAPKLGRALLAGALALGFWGGWLNAH